jgi:hypothetical protein
MARLFSSVSGITFSAHRPLPCDRYSFFSDIFHVAVTGWQRSQFGCRRAGVRAPSLGALLLYQLVQEYYPVFKAHLLAQGTVLPGYVEQEFEDYLKCGRLEHRFW